MVEEKPLIVSVSGISGAGKTETVKTLHNKLQNCSMLLYDDYNQNYDEFLKEIKSLKEKNQDKFIIIEDPVGIADSYKDIMPDYKIYIDTPLEVGLSRVLLRAILYSSDKGIADFYAKIGPQFKSSYKEEPSKLMHILVWLLESYLNKHREEYISDRNRMRNLAHYIVDGMKTTEEIVNDVISWLKSQK